MSYVYILTEHEKKEVDMLRERNRLFSEMREKRKSCNHNWKYDGHSHNDDCFICTICGEMEFR